MLTFRDQWRISGFEMWMKIIPKSEIRNPNFAFGVPEKYEDENCYFRYGVVKMWEQTPNDLLKHKDLLPLSAVCQATAGGENLLKQVAEKINEIEDKQERREKLDMARVFAGLRYKKNLVYEILREEAICWKNLS